VDTGDRPREAEMRTGIGDSHQQAERFDDASRQYHRAIAIAEEIGDRGALAHACGDTEEARVQWQRALDLYVDLGLPAADAVRTLLADTESTAWSPS
jgi:Flp pilus assembly protein TadD